MTNENFSFEEWMDALRSHARKNGGSANFEEEWQEDYENGLTPEESWKLAWE